MSHHSADHELPETTGGTVPNGPPPAHRWAERDPAAAARLTAARAVVTTLAEDNKTYDLSGQAGPLMEILQILKANNVPLNRMVDIRSNPGLRQQIQAVVRRAVEQQAPAPQPASAAGSAPVVTPPQPSIGQRLQELETLRAGGALTDQEYDSRRAQIISEI